MRSTGIFILIVSLMLIPYAGAVFSPGLINCGQILKPTGSYYTVIYQNLFTELLSISEPQVKAKVESAFNQFWCNAAVTSRQFFKRAANPKTGLTPDYAHFNGSPMDPPGAVDIMISATMPGVLP